jgi:hypothetical protein
MEDADTQARQDLCAFYEIVYSKNESDEQVASYLRALGIIQ